jgi:hypothetical protein
VNHEEHKPLESDPDLVAAVLLIVVGWIALGATMTISTAAMLAIMSLVPPAVVLLLWPAAQPATRQVKPRGSCDRFSQRCEVCDGVAGSTGGRAGSPFPCWRGVKTPLTSSRASPPPQLH